MDINEQKRYIFKKDYTTEMGTIHEGSQIDYIRGYFYFNGGMCDTYSNQMFTYIVNNPKLKNEYLTEVGIIYNKL